MVREAIKTNFWKYLGFSPNQGGVWGFDVVGTKSQVLSFKGFSKVRVLHSVSRHSDQSSGNVSPQMNRICS